METDRIEASQLSQADVEEFRRLMREECGVELTLAEGWERATKMVALFRVLIGPIPEDPGSNATSYPQQSSCTKAPDVA